MSDFVRLAWEGVRERHRLFESYVERIVGFFGGRVTLILFGSRARGDEMLSSDYDLAVVVEGEVDVLGLTEILVKMRPRGLPVDVVVFQKEELGDPLVTRMLTPCRMLYNGLGIQKAPCQ